MTMVLSWALSLVATASAWHEGPRGRFPVLCETSVTICSHNPSMLDADAGRSEIQGCGSGEMAQQ